MKLRIEITEGFGYFNRNCEICGTWFETAEHTNRLYDDEDYPEGGKNEGKIGVVCDECATAGTEAVKQHLRNRAEQLRKSAEMYEHAATTEIVMPNPEVAKAEHARIHAEDEAFWRKEHPEHFEPQPVTDSGTEQAA